MTEARKVQGMIELLLFGVSAISVLAAAGVAQSPTPSPTQRYCATPTPEPLYVDPVVSPTDELTQTVYVRTNNAERLEITSGAGTFLGEHPFDRVNVSLLPNTANHLRVTVHIRRIEKDGCTYGDYILSTTTDLHGAPLTIVQGTTHGPTIAVEPPTLTLNCRGEFEIKLRNVSDGDDALRISYVSLHHAYSQGDYGTDFTWDTSAIDLPLTLLSGEFVSIPVSYHGSGLFNSRLVLQVVSNARNNATTQYLAYAGKLCPTPTPTDTIETSTPTPTSTPYELCPPLSRIAPPAAPAGSVVAIEGSCYPMHSGRSADVYLDDELIGQASGETGGNFRTLLMIPAETPPGRHLIRLTQGDLYVLTSGPFDVTRLPGFCSGDCNRDGRVDVGEIVTGIGIALGKLDPSGCPGLDPVDELTIADIVAAVRNALEGCALPPDFQSFGGSYDVFVGRVSELAFPSGIGIHAGQATVRDGELFLELEYPPGLFEVSGFVFADGSAALEGVFKQDGIDPVGASGSVLLSQTESGEWISGELVFDLPGATAFQTLRFSMQR